MIQNDDFILRVKSLLSKCECDLIISWIKKNKDICFDNEKTGYHYADILEVPDELDFLRSATSELTDKFVSEYPEFTMRPDAFYLNSIRFKWWKPGSHFSSWHFEHSHEYSYRTAGLQIYLSDNNCYTEFKNFENEKSVAGNAIVFPASYTHIHRGQKDPDGIDKYVLSGYYVL
jgi:hypothetical protein